MKRGIWILLLVLGVAWIFRQNQAPHKAPESTRTATSSSAPPLTILAGSEVKDLEFLKPEMERAVGTSIRFVYSGTLDAVDRLKAPEEDAHYDLAWLANARYLSLAAPGVVKASEKMMLSPVILGVRENKARELGWDRKDPTWADVAEAVKNGHFRYGMTNPSASNSGFSAVVGVAAALSGKSDGLQLADIPTDKLKTFFAGQKLTSGSSGWLADAYVKNPDGLDGIINYESVILSLNAGDWATGKPNEKLVPVYPKEGIITSDYPLMLIDERQRPAYEKLAAFLHGDELQRRIMERTHRRPVDPKVPLASEFGQRLLIELPFPGSLDVLDGLLTTFLDDLSVPGHAYFVLDVSGSMAGARLEALEAGLSGLADLNAVSASARFSRFRLREKADLIAFSDKVVAVQGFDFGSAQRAEQLKNYLGFVGTLSARGGTGIYSALQVACQRAAGASKAEPGRYYSIVLMTDGMNNTGANFAQFRSYYATAGNCPARIFPILFGEGDTGEMESLAQLSNGRTFDGRKNSLTQVFRDIRGYQ